MPDKSDKPRDPTKVVALQVRLREETRARLQKAAKDSGRPMNTEIIERLERSLHDEEIFENASSRRLFAAMAQAVATAEGVTGKAWHSDVATFEATRLLVARVFQRTVPPAPNQEEIVSTFAAFHKAQVEAYSRARLLESQGILSRRVNALALDRVDERDPENALLHSGVYDPSIYETDMLLSHAFPPETRRIAAAVAYFKLTIGVGVDLSKPPETWAVFNQDGEKLSEEECVALNTYLKSLPARVEEAVEARTAYRIAFKPKGDALQKGRDIVASLEAENDGA